MRRALMVLVCVVPFTGGCSQKDKDVVEVKQQDAGGTTTHRVTDEVSKTGDHKAR